MHLTAHFFLPAVQKTLLLMGMTEIEGSSSGTSGSGTSGSGTSGSGTSGSGTSAENKTKCLIECGRKYLIDNYENHSMATYAILQSVSLVLLN